MKHAIRPCPVCDGAARDVLFEQQFAMIEGVSILDGYTVVACADCGATFADGVPPAHAFEEYYRASSKYVYSQRDGAESPADAERLAASARTIARLLEPGDRSVMDIGCASGRLLAELRGRGFPRIRGIDPSPDCAEAARRIHGVDAEPATLGELAGRGETFDLLILIGVLEHLVDLQAALGALRAVSHSGSRVYLEVPDVSGFADLPNAPFQEFSVEHVNYFSLASISRALATAGFRVEWHERGTPVQAGKTRVANLAVLAVRDETVGKSDAPDTDSRRGVERYIERCRREESVIRSQIDALADSRERVVLWGAGTFALRMLAVSRLADANVAAITDSNVRYHRRSIRGIPVISPDDSATLALPYVVMSQAFSFEISHQIRAISGPNPDIRTFATIPST